MRVHPAVRLFVAHKLRLVMTFMGMCLWCCGDGGDVIVVAVMVVVTTFVVVGLCAYVRLLLWHVSACEREGAPLYV